MDAINHIDRKMEPPEEDCLLSDLLWADPASNRQVDTDYVFNEKRSVSVVFGKRPVNALLQKEGLKSIIRAHEVKQQGYKQHFWNGPDEFPPVITVFSAPNYCGTYGNNAAIFVSDGEEVDIKAFTEKTDRPFTLPEYPLMDAFRFFHDDLTGYTLDFLYHMCRTAVSVMDGQIGKAL